MDPCSWALLVDVADLFSASNNLIIVLSTRPILAGRDEMVGLRKKWFEELVSRPDCLPVRPPTPPLHPLAHIRPAYLHT